MTRGVSQWIWPLELPERRLCDQVERACHALSLDDERTTFHPVLWTERDEKRPACDADGIYETKKERISQVWSAGVHSNVGGGYPDDSLAHIPLCWIMAEAQDCGLRYKPDAVEQCKAARDKDGRLYDSRHGLGGYYRYGPRKIYDLCHMRFSRRRDDEVEIAVAKIHESALKRSRDRGPSVRTHWLSRRIRRGDRGPSRPSSRQKPLRIGGARAGASQSAGAGLESRLVAARGLFRHGGCVLVPRVVPVCSRSAPLG